MAEEGHGESTGVTRIRDPFGPKTELLGGRVDWVDGWMGGWIGEWAEYLPLVRRHGSG